MAVRFQIMKTHNRETFERQIKASQAKRLDENLYKLIPPFPEPWVMETVQTYAPSWDYRVIERQFREKAWKAKETINNPKGAFVAYCRAVSRHPDRRP